MFKSVSWSIDMSLSPVTCFGRFPYPAANDSTGQRLQCCVVNESLSLNKAVCYNRSCKSTRWNIWRLFKNFFFKLMLTFFFLILYKRCSLLCPACSRMWVLNLRITVTLIRDAALKADSPDRIYANPASSVWSRQHPPHPPPSTG